MALECENCGTPGIKEFTYKFCSRDCMKAHAEKKREYNRGFEEGYEKGYADAEHHLLGG